MYRITVNDYFSSAHMLRGYKGKCEKLHGHNWKVEIEIEGEELDDIGLLIDFKDIKKILADSIEFLDHKLINDIEPFDKINPSSEQISKFLHERIGNMLPEKINIVKTSIWESENSKASYFDK